MIDIMHEQRVFYEGEIKDIVIADLALSFAFTMVFTGGIYGLAGHLINFLYFFPISLMAVSLSFVLHEYMHKVVAQRFGAIAAFRKSDQGLILTVISGMIGFLIGVPGATVIFSGNFTKKEEGYVSLAGPLTNFAVFLVFLGIAFFSGSYLVKGSYLYVAISTTLFISVLLAFFNMLPVYPLDGSKVIRWNILVYAGVIALIFIFMYITLVQYYSLYSPLGLIINLVILLVIAVFISQIYFGGRR